MTGVRRRGHLVVVAGLTGAAVVAALFAAPPEKPVDVRLVAPPPPSPEVVTATATTTVPAVGVVKPNTPAPPPSPLTTVQTEAPVRQPPPAPEPPPPAHPDKPKPPTVFDLLRCDAKLLPGETFDRCLDRPLVTGELCDLLPPPFRPGDPRGPKDDDPLGLGCDRG
ncbi:hypothetical protein SAMN05216553_102318 [Lentzea fradiae]|uniref:Excalibur calcium-binding domain-containing protein n=1 Tax=Lentzea fradiae TaxID=200378 RepID=A0A1G7MH69_9PSEU|nr:hypothetical protein [Lentzea fradiae]SDF61208.1 hypothetical protein SAMN05216553_102318 [Lentzea fradiae]